MSEVDCGESGSLVGSSLALGLVGLGLIYRDTYPYASISTNMQPFDKLNIGSYRYRYVDNCDIRNNIFNSWLAYKS
jgi:hypothetical protein